MLRAAVPSARQNNPELAEQIGWTQWPTLVPGQPSHSTIGGYNLAIGAHSRHQTEAADAIACITSRDNQIRNAIDGGLPPTLEDLYTDQRFIDGGYPFAAAIYTAPFMALLLLAGLALVPEDLLRAARADGATPWQAFLRVIVPLAAPGMVTTAILVFIFCWNDFLFAISLTSTEQSRTVPAAIAFFTGASQFAQPIGSIAAAAVVITIPIIIFVLLFQRRIVAGLTSGAVKG